MIKSDSAIEKDGKWHVKHRESQAYIKALEEELDMKNAILLEISTCELCGKRIDDERMKQARYAHKECAKAQRQREEQRALERNKQAESSGQQ